MYASHNSWTFRRPIKWWMRLLNFMGRCQNKNIQDQIKSGITLFDLRIRFHGYTPHIHHGAIDYGIISYYDLYEIYSLGYGVRILLESNAGMKDQARQESLFIQFCKSLTEVSYPGLKLYGGQRKYDWKKIVNLPEPPIIDKYSSTTSLFESDSKFLKVIDDWIPILYASLRNKKNLEEYEKSGDTNHYFMYDFV